MRLKAVLFGCAAMLAHASAMATSPVFEQAVLDGCKEESNAAGEIMTMRQDGIPMSELMDLIRKSPTAEVRIQHFVVSAYEVPRFMPYERRKLVADEFKNHMYSECLSRHAEGQAYSP